MSSYFSFLNSLGSPGGSNSGSALQINNITGLAAALESKLNSTALATINGQSLASGGDIAITGSLTPEEIAAMQQAISDLTQRVAALESGSPPPVVIAPTAITMSDSAETVQSNATLPLTLATLSADGSTPLTWSVTAGGAYTTLDLAGASPVLRLTSMPPAGALQITVRAENSAGFITANFALTVEEAQSANQAPSLASIPQSTATVGQFYTRDLTPFGSDPDGDTLTYTVAGLPAGLSNANGIISGTPTTAATWTITVTVADPDGLQASRTFGLVVAAASTWSVTASGSSVTLVSIPTVAMPAASAEGASVTIAA